jgi:hypothetical protein
VYNIEINCEETGCGGVDGFSRLRIVSSGDFL